MKNLIKSKFKIHNHKQLLIFSAIALGIICPSNMESQPLSKTKFNEFNTYSSKSFITKAVERTGSSVVTIETQRYVKKGKNTNYYFEGLECKFYHFGELFY